MLLAIASSGIASTLLDAGRTALKLRLNMQIAQTPMHAISTKTLEWVQYYYNIKLLYYRTQFVLCGSQKIIGGTSSYTLKDLRGN